MVTSKTYQDAMQKQAMIQQLLRRTGMSYETWAGILFDTGCSFIESKLDNCEVRDELLKDARYKYWDWWWMQYVTDDEFLCDLEMNLTPVQYQRTKERMAALKVVDDNFRHYLRSLGYQPVTKKTTTSNKKTETENEKV